MVVIIVVYVDDLLVASATKRDEEQALKDLHSFFPTKDLGEASFYLGCHILRDRDAGTLRLDQHQYVRALVERFETTKTSAIPSAAGGKPLSKADGHLTHADAEKMRRIPYRKAVRALMWVATITRPDLSFAAHQLAKSNDDPGPTHWKAARKALQYLCCTRNLGITYGGTPGEGAKLSACVDADHGTCHDTRRLVSGGEVMMGNGANSSLSRVQKVTAAASSESEYVVLAGIVNELRFLRQVKKFMMPPTDTRINIHEDNEGDGEKSFQQSTNQTRGCEARHHSRRNGRGSRARRPRPSRRATCGYSNESTGRQDLREARKILFEFFVKVESYQGGAVLDGSDPDKHSICKAC